MNCACPCCSHQPLAAGLFGAKHRVAISDIQRRVAEHYRIDPAEMTSDRRARIVARPRQIAMYLARRHTPLSIPNIGRRFGNRDHTTVIHAVRTITSLIAQDGDMARDIAELEAGL